jgi:hypothetical protein
LNIVQARANDRLRVGIILGVVALTMSQAAAVAANSPEITVYEHSRGQLTTNGIQLADDVVYLPLSLLTQSWGLTEKKLPEGRIGICRGDRCIPFAEGDGPKAMRRMGGVAYFPARHLAKGLGASLVWLAEERLLLVDLSTRRAGQPVVADAPFELTLPDLDGKPFTLSKLRGKRVLLFAWASW